MFLNYKLKVCSEVSLLLLLLYLAVKTKSHPYEIRTHHHSSDSAVSSPSRPMDVKSCGRGVAGTRTLVFHTFNIKSLYSFLLFNV